MSSSTFESCLEKAREVLQESPIAAGERKGFSKTFRQLLEGHNRENPLPIDEALGRLIQEIPNKAPSALREMLRSPQVLKDKLKSEGLRLVKTIDGYWIESAPRGGENRLEKIEKNHHAAKKSQAA